METARRWRTTIEWRLAGRDPMWPMMIVAIGRPRMRAPYRVPPARGAGQRLEGLASYYWQDQMTATGELFDRRELTAAHLTLPFGTRVAVVNVINGRSVVVRINDRGPYIKGRIIDLSDAAAGVIGMREVGVVPVKLTILNDSLPEHARGGPLSPIDGTRTVNRSGNLLK
jgi:rare lipoprotein A (peptidoglycan hydrolase)